MALVHSIAVNIMEMSLKSYHSETSTVQITERLEIASYKLSERQERMLCSLMTKFMYFCTCMLGFLQVIIYRYVSDLQTLHWPIEAHFWSTFEVPNFSSLHSDQRIYQSQQDDCRKNGDSKTAFLSTALGDLHVSAAPPMYYWSFGSEL